MNIFMNYNFLADGNALDPFIVNTDNFTEVDLNGGIYNHYNATNDVSQEYSTDIPTVWTNYTIMNAAFEGNTSAGSLADITEGITAVKIKRKKIDEYEWITIKVVPVETIEDLTFAITDNLAANMTEYQYAYVPIMENGVEGNYVLSTILSKFNGIFICDEDSIYKYMAGVSYGDTTNVQKIGTFEPFGRKYPVVVANGLTNYQTGSFNGYVFPAEYYDNNDRQIDRRAIVEQRNSLVNFLTNKKAKILKDFNGNIWLIAITGQPTTSYANEYGMGVVSVGASWAEIGDSNSSESLYNAGLVPVKE